MKTKQAIQIEINKLLDEPLATIFQDDILLFVEFLEHETDMDFRRFLKLVEFLAGEYLDMYRAYDLWGDE